MPLVTTATFKRPSDPLTNISSKTVAFQVCIHRTEVGEFELSHSPYGTFDQGGNVLEWNETEFIGTSRGLTGGQFYNSEAISLAASPYSFAYPADEADTVGFRVAAIAEVVTTTSVTVDSKSNIYAAGLATTDGVYGGGIPPTSVSFPAGPDKVLTFSSVTGTVNYYGGMRPNTAGPDGYGPSFSPYLPGEFPTPSLPFNGLSGLRDNNNAAYLIGVFLADTAPAEPAPPMLDFSNYKNFASLSPQIGQLFFIGDGRTGTGTGDTQKFYVPSTATRLILGFTDSGFFNNIGALTATLQISKIPEPTTLALLVTCAGVAGSCMRRRRYEFTDN